MVKPARWSAALGLGAGIGAILSMGLLALMGAAESGFGEALAPLWYIPARLCEWLGAICFGAGNEAGLIFVLPSFLLYGAVIGIAVAACIRARRKQDRGGSRTQAS